MIIVSDLGGTLVDEKCMAPIIALQQALETHGFSFTEDEIRRDLGLRKWEHIGKLISINSTHKIHDIYNTFIDELRGVKGQKQSLLMERSYPVPGAVEFINWCRERQFPVVITTGYPKDIALDHIWYTRKNGWKECPQNVVAADEFPNGRPYPYMIFEAMKRMGIKSVAEVFKIGDTDNDIEAALNAGLQNHQTFKIKGNSFDFELAKDKILFTYHKFKENRNGD